MASDLMASAGIYPQEPRFSSRVRFKMANDVYVIAPNRRLVVRDPHYFGLRFNESRCQCAPTGVLFRSLPSSNILLSLPMRCRFALPVHDLTLG
jgi:hypothetical protein